MKKHNRLELPDILRGLAVIFMIVIHVLNVYGNQAASQGIRYEITDFMGGPPAAPVFMAIMGFFFQIKKPILPVAIKRGVQLTLLGYGLNFVRGFLPVFLAKEFMGWDASAFPEMYSYYYLLWNVDILIFAGLAFIGMGLLSQISERPLFLIGSAALIGIISPFLWGIGSDLPILGHILNPIWGADPDLVTFPFFPWMVYPILGMVAAIYYKREIPPRKLLKRSLLAGTLLFASGGILLFINFDRFFNDYGQQSWGAVLAFSGFIILWSLLIMGVNRLYPDNWKTGFLRFLSKNLTVIYVFQWLLIGWAFWFIPFHSLSYAQVMIMTVVVTVLSCLGTLTYKKLSDVMSTMRTHLAFENN